MPIKLIRPLSGPQQQQLKRRTEESSSQTSTVQQMMQKLEKMEQAGAEHGANSGHNRWMVPYADLLTILLGVFLVLFTSTQKPATPNAPTLTPQTISQTSKITQTKTEQTRKTEQSRDLALAKQIQQKIGAKLPMQGIEIHQQDRGIVISLKDSILFSPGSTELSPVAQGTLHRLIQQLHAALGGQTRSIRVEGHTDNTPIATSKYPSNWELSTARATTIVRFLINSHHFKPQLLSAAGYGEFKPVKDNSSIEGKQKNRRVDIVVLKPDVARQEPPILSKPIAAKPGRK